MVLSYRGHVGRAVGEYRHVDTNDTATICGAITENTQEP